MEAGLGSLNWFGWRLSGYFVRDTCRDRWGVDEHDLEECVRGLRNWMVMGTAMVRYRRYKIDTQA